ncbi:hypothetical protein SRABI96_02713 [Peribacillus sp. Bi96]|uniref:DUF4306 domain-containing protein n=1 Tax=unclassified Peribacillus TaxID=2675266 RepID=UPI001D763402|nr:DUF4306 domain-containing protein [Peribacillus sp. Bi96]CAH0232466.1 hypothetical protein SRABI96_02713 [Peribacillus sp. Bi96]
MSFKYIFQMIIAAIFFLLFSVCTWYEGSEILDNPWEWKYSTYFSQASDDQVMDAQDISDLDYFVYAAKFKPTFPIFMILAASYLIILTGYILFKGSIKRMALFLSGLGALFLLSSVFVSNTPTVGGTIFQVFFLISGMISIMGAALYYFWMSKGFKTEI